MNEELSAIPEQADKLPFEQRFEAGRRTYDILGGSVEAVFLTPENPKTNIPVILAPGWSEDHKVLKQSVAALYAAGRPVIALEHPRHGAKAKDVRKALEGSGHEDMPVAELRKALTILNIVHEHDISQVDMITHSEGGVNGTLAGLIEPGLIRNMVVMNAPLVGEDSVPRVLSRFAKKNMDNYVQNRKDREARRQVFAGQFAGAKYIARNPVRAGQEIHAVTYADLPAMLRVLHEQGTGIVAIGNVDDAGYQMDRIQQVVKSTNRPNGFVDGFLSVKGGHDELYIHPELHMGAAEKMLTALEKKQDKGHESAKGNPTGVQSL